MVFIKKFAVCCYRTLQGLGLQMAQGLPVSGADLVLIARGMEKLERSLRISELRV